MEKKPVVEQINTEQWENLFDGSIRVPFSSSAWIESISNCYGYEHDLLAVFKDDKPVAGLCVYYNKKGKRKFACHPQLTPYNTIVFNRAMSSSPGFDPAKLLSPLADFILSNYIYPYFLLDPSIPDSRPFQWAKWNAGIGYTYLVNPSSALVDADIRRRAKRCTEDGFYVKHDFDTSAFWSLFESTAQRQGINLKISENEFAKLLLPVKEKMAWMISSYDKDHVLHASWIQMNCNDEYIYNWNAASNASMLSKGGTPFLVVNLLDKIKNAGFRQWDLCGADHPSVARFKSGLGGSLTPYAKVSYAEYPLLQKLMFRMSR